MENKQIVVIRGDITKMEVDAIVNAANKALAGGGGVDGAIHRAGGPAIAQECTRIRKQQGGCDTGEAVYTSAGNLKACHIIHTVGPIYNKAKNEQMKHLLANCYINSLKLAVQLGAKTMAFPNIGTGIYGFPKMEAANIAIQTVIKFLATSQAIEKVIFVCYDQENYDLYQERIS